jgi:hypothetical protein
MTRRSSHDRECLVSRRPGRRRSRRPSAFNAHAAATGAASSLTGFLDSRDYQSVTGVSDPYEAPPNPDVIVHSDRETVDESLERIPSTLADRGLVDRSAIDAAGVGAGRA